MINEENLIKYQKLDIELVKLRKDYTEELEKNKSAKKENQDKLIELDKNAEKLVKYYTAMEKGINLSSKMISSNDLEKMTDKELEDLLAKCNKTISDLDRVSKVLASQSQAKENDIVNQFKDLKNKIGKCNKKIADIEPFTQMSNEEKEDKKQQIKQEMLKLEKDISENDLKIYKDVKNKVKAFPIIVTKNDKRACGKEITLEEKEDSSNGYILCRNCGRIILTKKTA